MRSIVTDGCYILAHIALVIRAAQYSCLALGGLGMRSPAVAGRAVQALACQQLGSGVPDRS
jgi:hypothetical protein